MKASLLLGTLTMLTASLPGLGMSELEQLRTRCLEQEKQIRHLEEQLRAQGQTSQSPVSNTKPSTPDTYVVKSGDSLERIAGRFKTSPETIARINGLKLSAMIHPGQKLKVPGSVPTTSSAREEKSPSSPLETYNVREGDTYSSISRQTGIPVQRLIEANPQVKATAMRPGQQIRLPRERANGSTAEPTTPPKQPANPEKPANTATPTTALAATSPPAAPPADTPPSPPNAERKIRPVMIEGEMTYGDFASQYGTNIVRLNDLNGLDLTSATVLARGSELYVPAQP